MPILQKNASITVSELYTITVSIVQMDMCKSMCAIQMDLCYIHTIECLLEDLCKFTRKLKSEFENYLHKRKCLLNQWICAHSAEYAEEERLLVIIEGL